MNKIAMQLSLFAVAFLAACSTNTEKKVEEKYKVASPLVMDTVYQNEYVAEIHALQNVEIRNRIKGFIENIYVDEGQTVSQGQTLFSTSSRMYQQNLLKAKAILKSAMADLKSAEIELESTRKLVEKKIVAKSELELLKARVDATKAKIEEVQADEAQANNNLSFAQVRAPFDGIINRIPHKMGSLVEEGTLLTTISNNKEVYAYFKVSETDYLNYRAEKNDAKSKEVSLLLANGNLHNHVGMIETTESQFDRSTGNIAFRAKFANPEQLLKHGSTGKVLVKTVLKNAMFIPQKATFEIQDNIYVYVLDANNVVHMRRIFPKLRMQNVYVLESGLTANEKIVLEGIQLVKDGEKISTILIPSKQAIQSIN